MTFVEIFALIFCSFFVLVAFVSGFIIYKLYLKIKSLESYVLFYEELFDIVSSISTKLVAEGNEMLRKNVVLNTPEMQNMFALIRYIRDTYQKLVMRYNAVNKYRNFIDIEEPEEKKESGNKE